MPVVRRYNTVAEAQVVAATLEGHGIPAELVNEAIVLTLPRLSSAVDGVGVFVAQEHVTECLKILGVEDVIQQQKNVEKHLRPLREALRKATAVATVASIVIFCAQLCFRPTEVADLPDTAFIALLLGAVSGAIYFNFKKYDS